MDPSSLQALQALAILLDKIGTLPLISVFFLSQVCPWVFMIILHLGQNRRFEAVKRMYEDNVKLVESYENMAQSQQELSTLTISTNTKLIEMMENNLFCPVVRKHVKQKEI